MASVQNGGTPPKAKKTLVEEIYQKKSQLEHILLRPDTYIGENSNYNYIYFSKVSKFVLIIYFICFVVET